MRRIHILLAMFSISAIASEQHTKCDPCVDGPEMFEHRNQVPPSREAKIEAVAIDYDCAGPVSRTYGGFKWLFSSCNPFQVVIEPGPGNPSIETFTLGFESGKIRLSGRAPQDRRFRRAYKELRSLDEKQVQAIVRELDALRSGGSSRPDTSLERTRER
jgi:hypothetical protein